jgi:ABC-type transport system involved in multi-copper enzyme maturation permease subunit
MSQSEVQQSAIRNRRSAISLASMAGASMHLFAVSLRRLFFSRQTLVSLVLTVLVCLLVYGWSRQPEPTVKKFAEEVLVLVHAAFLVPIFAICYGTSAVGGEREDRTLVYLLITPLPRPLVYLVKFAAAVTLVLGWTVGSLIAIGFVGRPWGMEAVRLFWPALVLGATAYTSLFHTLGAAFRRGTIISLAYTFFLEGLLGNMPGLVKRVSLSFYLSCMIYDAGLEYEVAPLIAREMFLPVTGRSAMLVLAWVAVGLFVAGVTVFTRREYRDLS